MAALQWKIGPSSSSVRLLPNSHPASSVKLSTSSCIVNMATYARPFSQSRRGNIKKLKTKPNSLPILKKMHVKLGDPVKVISGHDKGKIGEVISINKKEGTIIVKDVNMKTKHVAGRQEGESGQIVQVEGPIHSSNVMLYSNTQNVASRVGHKILEDGTKVRYLLKTGEVIDNPENWKRVLKEQKEDKKEK